MTIMASNIKVDTIINIMNVYNTYQRRVQMNETKLEFYKTMGNETDATLTQAELDKDKKELGEFLDYYI